MAFYNEIAIYEAESWEKKYYRYQSSHTVVLTEAQGFHMQHGVLSPDKAAFPRIIPLWESLRVNLHFNL